MSSIFFPGGGNTAPTTTVSGLDTASGVLYVLLDGTRPMQGALTPVTDETISIGLLNSSFASGFFSNKLVIGNIDLFSVGIFGSPTLQIKLVDNPSMFGGMRLAEFRTNPLNIKFRDSRVSFGNTSNVVWFSGELPSTTYDINISRKFTGMVRIGTTAANSNGGIIAQSGMFPSGIILIAPNGSGWLVSTDSNNNLTTSGPLLV